MTTYRVYEFVAGKPKWKGLASSGYEAATILGCDRAYLAPIRDEGGLCYTKSEDDTARAIWNKPVRTPQL